MTREEKVAAFRRLHVPGAPFVLPNPWDIGSARVLGHLGAKALATTSSGHAFTLGRRDMGRVSRDEALEHAALIADATVLPVSGDFENGFGDDPDFVAETVRLAAAAGLAGVSIEDTEMPGGGAYAFDLATARIEAAVDAARSAGIVLTARADGWLNRTYDGAEAVRRCTAFAEAGADVIYAPLVRDDVAKEICRIGTPVNVLAAGRVAEHSVSSLGNMGVARISTGGTLARLAQRAVLEAGRQILGPDGDLSVLSQAAGLAEIDEMLAG
ncbi:MAG: isocitrate lyase/phosphoenolpyruvate mutase family protein [Pseudomonadota bacterium]